MKILIVADEPGWIFERHALEIKKRLPEFDIDIVFRRENIPEISKNYDLVYVMDPIPLRHGYSPPEKTIMGLRCEFLFEQHPMGASGLYLYGFPGRCVSIRDKCKAFHVVNRNQMRVFKGIVTDKPLFLAQHGIDEGIFNKQLYDSQINHNPMVVGTAGRNSALKGFHLIEEACKRLSIDFDAAQYGSNKWEKGDMPQYYQKLDVYACMSESEGLSNGILEGGAMGLPVISTKVGAAKEIIEDGVNGFLVERNVDSLTDALNKLQDESLRRNMGEQMYKEIMSNWTWEKRIEDFRFMFNECLK